MRRLGTKLIAGFAFFLVMIVAVGLYSSLASQASLQSSIGQSSVFVANEMMISMNFTLYNWLDRLEIRAMEPGDPGGRSERRTGISMQWNPRTRTCIGWNLPGAWR